MFTRLPLPKADPFMVPSSATPILIWRGLNLLKCALHFLRPKGTSTSFSIRTKSRLAPHVSAHSFSRLTCVIHTDHCARTLVILHAFSVFTVRVREFEPTGTFKTRSSDGTSALTSQRQHWGRNRVRMAYHESWCRLPSLFSLYESSESEEKRPERAAVCLQLIQRGRQATSSQRLLRTTT